MKTDTMSRFAGLRPSDYGWILANATAGLCRASENVLCEN